MKKFTIVILLSALAGSPVFSQTSTKDAKVEKLLTTMNVDKQVDSIFGQISAMFEAQMPQGSTPEQKAKFKEAQHKVFELIRSQMSWEKMRPQYVKLYSESFSEEEIDGMAAFYATPAGQSMLSKMPLVLSKSMAMAQGIVKQLTPQIQQITKETMEQKDAPK
jgi:hypothetical protein